MEGTNPAQPLIHLFVIADLRQLKGHRKQEIDAGIKTTLSRLGIDVQEAAGGWEAVLDRIYDGAIEDLRYLEGTLGRALETD